MGRKACVHNLGCKVNAYESQAMQQLLNEAGYEIVPFAPGADVYVINTCSVTNIADRKSRQMLHKAKKMNPEAIVVAAGCYVQTGSEKLIEDGTVDLILGNNRKQNIVEALDEFYKSRTPSADIIEINRTKEYENLSISGDTDRARAFVKVQDGCNQFCTYCIIPYARGRVRSRVPEDVLEEVRVLVSAGYREIVLTGIHLSSYGADFDGREELLIDLIKMTAQVPGVMRIRLGSLEPGIITEEFAAGLSKIPQICPHFHLSLQSGCDETLARMNRRYRTKEYAEKCALLRKYFDRPALTTDIITGFPGETDEEFESSYRFVSDIHFFETHVFPYSRRKGTKADKMAGQLPEHIKKERSARLLELDKERRKEYASSFIGQEVEVLIEEETFAEGQKMLTGHSREYLNILIPFNCSVGQGDIVKVKVSGITEVLHCNLIGTII